MSPNICAHGPVHEKKNQQAEVVVQKIITEWKKNVRSRHNIIVRNRKRKVETLCSDSSPASRSVAEHALGPRSEFFHEGNERLC